MQNAVEKKIRRQLRLVRFANGYLPLSILRKLIGVGLKRVKVSASIVREKISADGVACEWFIPDDSREDSALMYIHGGGFTMGMTHLHCHMLAYLAEKMNTRIFVVDYRLAPEFPFPAALEDCVTAYKWLLKHGFSPTNLALAGDSAGGNLTLTTLMKLRDSGLSLPATAVCLSPVADLTKAVENLKQNYDPLLHPRAGEMYNQSYVGNADASDLLISPVFGNWEDLPPLLIYAGEDEVLSEDAKRIEELARDANTGVKLDIYPRMWHVWQVFLKLPQAAQSLDDIAQFILTHLD